MTDKPKWWPQNPYFESAMDSIKNGTDYVRAVPGPQLRTAVSWYLSNRAWELASNDILEAMQNSIQEMSMDD